MTKNPTVSVLMPVYNTKESYLREAIESIQQIQMLKKLFCPITTHA